MKSVIRAITILLAASFQPVLVNADEAVNFSLPDIQGKSVSLADYRGKWVVVNYWATWCPPCKDEIPDLVEFHDKHHDKDAVVLGVNAEDIDLEKLIDFSDSFMIGYPILRSSPLAESPLGGVPGLPTTYIVSPEGVPVARQVGPITSDLLEKYINKKIQEAKK
jgi:thiol-disulfide isomerase/thioredoxin